MPEADAETEERTFRSRLDNLGPVFGKSAAVSAALFLFSTIGTALYTISLPDNSWDSIFPLIVIGSTWAGIWLSLFGYGVWSLWKLKSQSPDHISDDIRFKRALLGFALGIFVLLFAVSTPRGT